MKPIDWRKVLGEHHVVFVERGPNVKRGELNIQCPFCGAADPSHHMGLNPDTGYWACWRNSDHRGKSPLRLLVQLLRVPYWRARKIAGLEWDDNYADPDGFDAVAARIMGREQLEKVEHVRRKFLAFPVEFAPIETSPDRFFFYFSHHRGFGRRGTMRLGSSYDVRYCQRGTFKDRVILPYLLNGQLVAWTGRAVAPAMLRYRDLEVDACLVPIKETLFNHDAATHGGTTLVVVEGPVDALKIDLFGEVYRTRAVALSTNSITDAQIYLLEELAPEFKRVLVMMDMASELGVVDGMRMAAKLRSIPNVVLSKVPFGAKDAAELTPQQVHEWARSLA